MSCIRLACICFLFTHFANGQSASQELKFSQYLINKKLFDEAIYTLNHLYQTKLESDQRDSVNYLLGNIYYNQQQLQNSINHFDLVSAQLPRLKSESVFFSSFNEAYLRRFPMALKKIENFSPLDSVLLNLKNFEMAGIYLLQRNYTRFDSLAPLLSADLFLIKQHHADLITYRNDLRSLSKKSPFKAGLLSALVPGAGKFYAGYRGQGFFNFLVAGLLAVQAWEGYHKAGPESFKFIAYASLFSAFYISNIWGSTLAVKVRRDEISKAIDAQILFAMHIPIRSAFH